ncbi:uncharacterized protein BDZ99DRAFT_516584 [Mytilinidion resinicola]|uniref:Uncharacterized protein n=1 Tax=Mytilinidion resinicola TaxID=574789 RepID=A0A6A6YYX8_9PEZI|nr:uncharacterized protein BDZ99DRAFT_516584 [Mytilinidion resinicola]KAF2813960.1 hypothetical protein BDZ99DRAFT_516584 [Mytilinidion resinicola]
MEARERRRQRVSSTIAPRDLVHLAAGGCDWRCRGRQKLGLPARFLERIDGIHTTVARRSRRAPPMAHRDGTSRPQNPAAPTRRMLPAGECHAAALLVLISARGAARVSEDVQQSPQHHARIVTSPEAASAPWRAGPLETNLWAPRRRSRRCSGPVHPRPSSLCNVLGV